ncbi:MAG: ATP-binding protein [Holophagales bacterium]|nr:ATP-binding protein [Holophagales bacterium]
MGIGEVGTGFGQRRKPTPKRHRENPPPPAPVRPFCCTLIGVSAIRIGPATTSSRGSPIAARARPTGASAPPNLWYASPVMPTVEEPQVRISIGSRYDHIDLIQVVVDDALGRLGLDDDARHWVGIAIREAVANAIKHGNQQDPDKVVEVELAIAGEHAVIRVHDHGEGFDPESVGDPLAPENLLKPNGRGIFYMRNFMDEITYLPRPEGGTVVTMRKRLSQVEPEAGDATTEETGAEETVGDG